MNRVETSIQAVAADRRAIPGLLAMWHLLSLDAPAVAAGWCWFLARAIHQALPSAIPAATFLAVWLLYAADRLLDARAGKRLEARHTFHWRHRRAFAIGMGAATALLVTLLRDLTLVQFRLYVTLGALLLAWFGLIHLQGNDKPETLPKELAPGAFFAAAVFLPILPAASTAAISVLLTACLFGMVCSLNCLYIFAWEHDAHQQAHAHATTRMGIRWLTPLAVFCAAAPMAEIRFAPPELAPVLFAIALAAALLLGLDRAHVHLDRTNLRAAADLALLTPLVVAPFFR